MTDLDIDFADRTAALACIDHVFASRLEKDKLIRHTTGIYVQNIPHNPVNKASTLDYKEADTRGYFKIDFLNVGIYNGVRDNDHLTQLMETEPVWELLIEEEFVNLLFHINGHIAVLKQMQPTSLEQLAAVLAMIRPAKKHLIGSSWTTIMNEIWIPSTDGTYGFRKAHAFSYAMAVIVQMNLIIEQLSTPN